MKKRSRAVKLAACAICGVVFLLNVIGNPLLKLNVDIAETASLHATIEHKGVEISDEDRETLIDRCADLKAAWFPSTELNGLPYFANDELYYMNLVFGKQMFLDIFVLKDGSIISYVHPWDNSGRAYAVKNPEVLRDVANIMTAIGAEAGIVQS